MSVIEEAKQNPMYFCLDRETAEKFLCHDVSRIPACSGERATVFQTKKGAINSMGREAKETLKDKDFFRFMVFGFYFSGLSPIWIDKKECKGQPESLIVSDGKILHGDAYTAKNCISIKDFFFAESWCFYKDINKKIRCHKDYKIIDMDLNDDLSEPIYPEDNDI